MPDLVVRFTGQFFERLGALLPEERPGDGTPSITDFLLLDLPRVRDALVSDYERSTLPTDIPDIRVLIGAGVLVDHFALYMTLNGRGIDVFWVTFDRPSR